MPDRLLADGAPVVVVQLDWAARSVLSSAALLYVQGAAQDMTDRSPDYTWRGALHSFFEAFTGCLTALTIIMAIMILASIAVLILIWWQYPASRWWLGIGGAVVLGLVAWATAVQYGGGTVESD